MEIRVLDAGIALGKSPEVRGLTYNLGKLVITVEPDVSGKLLEVVFEASRGFRCLDEGDLLDFWQHQTIIDNWLFEILEGGWLDYEDQRGGFISKAMGYREFLICGVDDCVSVISNEPPKFEVKEVAPDPEN